MIIFLWLMLALVPWLIGAAVQAVLHWKTSEVIHMTDSWITGSLCCIGLGEALWFFNPYSPTCRPNFPSEVGVYVTRIRNHCFYNHTAAYYDT